MDEKTMVADAAPDTDKTCEAGASGEAGDAKQTLDDETLDEVAGGVIPLTQNKDMIWA